MEPTAHSVRLWHSDLLEQLKRRPPVLAGGGHAHPPGPDVPEDDEGLLVMIERLGVVAEVLLDVAEVSPSGKAFPRHAGGPLWQRGDNRLLCAVAPAPSAATRPGLS